MSHIEIEVARYAGVCYGVERALGMACLLYTSKFNAALVEYNGLKQELPALEDEWLELSTTIEEETARGLA